ncbi:YpmS family protein [Priestia koreensis]|uniref:YpmS family protein n=1 Tax=Priestia koreensis TaxID=284581 RepID=UPI001F597F5D|nr:YpmS family protein [Priestia koreensis]MCM3003415.1 YpmS family protein [Priestia koreensis]UNL86208.1 YpmS family protein [Priestia koreensis]
MKKWKRLFWGLLTLNIVIVLVVIVLIFQPADNQPFPSGNQPQKNQVELTILAKKKDLNALIDKYLQKEFHNEELNYNVRLTDQVEVNGTIQAFDNKLDVQMAFEPHVQKNGGIILEQKSLSVGKLQLPVRTVLKYVNNNFNLPDYVKINPADESVYVGLQEMKTTNDFRVKVEKFNLEKDEFRFKLIDSVK